MDRGRMNADRMSDEYEKGVDYFIWFAETHKREKTGIYFCLCVNCGNIKCQNVVDIRNHLIMEGILTDYKVWFWHGEETNIPVPEHNEMHYDDDHVEDMINDVEHESFQKSCAYKELRTDSEKPLYPGCDQYWTRLTAVLEVTNVKARNGWSNKSFTDLLLVLGRMLPDKHTLPSSHYEASKIMCPMGLGHQKIHACPNDCLLYINEFKDLDQCPKCGVSRYKIKTGVNNVDEGSNRRPPAKILWYLPIIPRFKRLFENVEDAKNLTWHSDERKSDAYIRHPADSLQWKNIDVLFPDFGRESRNLRLGLSTDGMNPYGALSSTHSSWPVFLIIYNLPPSLCMKRKYVMLAMMISDPKQPGNDIDVYLSPLIEDLKLLWVNGVDVFDGHRRQNFVMRALLFCTINDFPAYGNLSGYNVKGHHACPIFEYDTSYIQLKHGRKTVYTRHRRFLRRDHPYRRFKKPFNGRQETENAPIPLSGKQVFDRVKNIDIVFGKSKKKINTQNIWKKKSIFFDLPYWEHLDARQRMGYMIVLEVLDSAATTLLPEACGEFVYVLDALNSFVPWPRRLLGDAIQDNHPKKKKQLDDDPLRRLALLSVTELYGKTSAFPWDPVAFGIETDVALHISFNDLNDINRGGMWLSASSILLWITYLIKDLRAANDVVYAFFEPSSISDIGGNNVAKTSAYMLRHMQNSQKQIFLGAYNKGGHWQLVVVQSRTSYAIWFCSMYEPPGDFIKNAVQDAVKKYTAAAPGTIIRPVKNYAGVDWLYPKCNKQPEKWECGYYVLEWMTAIVRVKITNQWLKVFKNPDAFPVETIINIRKEWATRFLADRIPVDHNEE